MNLAIGYNGSLASSPIFKAAPIFHLCLFQGESGGLLCAVCCQFQRASRPAYPRFDGRAACNQRQNKPRE